MTDGLSHGSRRLWIRVAAEILGLEQKGNTEMTAMEDEDKVQGSRGSRFFIICHIHNHTGYNK